MIIKRISGCTRVCGERQGYIGLPIRDTAAFDATRDQYVPRMMTAWEPTPAELKAIMEGRPIIVSILGQTPPPMMLLVEDENGQPV